MHSSTQHNTVELGGLIANPYAIGFQKRAASTGYSNGLSVALKNIQSRAKDVLGINQARCPDGEVHHPSVCLRGWRGDVCSNCKFVGN
jgi:hypothetical protein